jgi:CheY-like chemotaxis protein
MDGLRVAREVRALGQKVKIVGFTTSAPDGERDEAMDSAFDGFLRKPFRPRQIFECLETQLGVRYIYREPVRHAHSRHGLRAEALASIPAELRNDLASALVSLDVERITESIRGISRQDAVVGEILRSGAEQYAFTSILRAVTACEAQTSKEIS